MARAVVAAPPPLLVWQKRAEALRREAELRAIVAPFAAERARLHAMIRRLPPRSFRRIRLEALVAELAARQLAAEMDWRAQP